MTVAGGRTRDSGLRVAVRVTPGAARTAVGGRRGESLVIRVTARPAGGAANRAALRAAAAAFGVPASDVTLISGAASRDKVIEITGNPAALRLRLDELSGS
jgi:uncharacterized protein (TIGR00251 family)